MAKGKARSKKVTTPAPVKATVPAVTIPANDDIAKALWNTGGLLKHTAAELGCELSILKGQIKKSKQLRDLLFTIRETCLDEVEDVLFKRITGDGDMGKIKDGSGILTMFYLKCLGKHRGWIDRPEKAGGSANKPVYIKILPVGVDAEEPRKAGRPKKMYAEIKVLPEDTRTQEEKDLEEIIDAEVLDDEQD